jgi:hypothetical protein
LILAAIRSKYSLSYVALSLVLNVADSVSLKAIIRHELCKRVLITSNEDLVALG